MIQLSGTAQKLRDAAFEKKRQSTLLLEEAKKLLEAADVLENTKDRSVSTDLEGHQLVITTEPNSRSDRRRELAGLIKSKGPLRRSEIFKFLPDLPKGTLGYLLNNKQWFKSVEGKRWDVAD